MFQKEINRWLRALEIAKILFDDQGYHCLYLDAIEKRIRRKYMYSPKISEDLIPKIFQVAKAERIPMTTLVNRILEEALNGGGQLAAKEVLSAGEAPDLPQKDGESVK